MRKEWVLENTYLKLAIGVRGKFIEAELQDNKSGRILAQGPYLYRLEREVEEGRLTTDSLLFQEAEVNRTDKKAEVLQIKGRAGELEITHQFLLSPDKPFLKESFTLYNRGSSSIKITNLRFGFTRPLTDAIGVVVPELEEDRFVAVPYRRDTFGQKGEYQDYSISDIMNKRGQYRVVGQEKAVFPAEYFGAEGWVWIFKGRSLLFFNYSQEHMEFSLIGIDKADDGIRLIFGGCGKWHQDPECFEEISAGEKILCGQNRYQLLNGGFKEGYYTFRHFMNEKGHFVPKGFNPPVHWNELYDNRYWQLTSGRDTPEARKIYYRLEDMEEEAAKAKELGCESLYLDPGWDTSLASTIWDEERLGSIKSFVHLMKEKYGLDVSLHCPLAGWCDPSAYPRQADRMDADGKRLEGELCSGAKQYLDEKAKRLLKLCQAGITFLMYDGTYYTGPCFDKSHGHPIPYTREAHCRAYLELVRMVHREFPHVLVEMHDMIVGGVCLRYCPTYYLHGLSHSFDENWGFEYMWDPMEDLLSGWAVSLYYYNLAYSLPLYLHINLRMDNMHCLEFWWYASTCRHLGVGGRHSELVVWQAHKSAMQRYLRLKEFYTQGIFYGFGEDIHIHVLPEKQAAVINLFNLTGREILQQGSFSLEEIGISSDASLIIEDKRCCVKDSSFEFNRRMPPHSAAIIEIWPVKIN